MSDKLLLSVLLVIVGVVAASMLFGQAASGSTSSPLADQLTHLQTKDSPNMSQDKSQVTVRVFNGEGDLQPAATQAKVVKSEAEWRAQLSDEEYRITRKAGTEPAFCGGLLDNKEEGVYACVCCGLPLFQDDSKFKSGTGWPSFYKPIAEENITEHEDVSYGMVRTEIVCTRCDAHLGHVFPDGPKPTGLRYCLNSAALTFVPEDQIGAKLGEDPAAAQKAEASAPAETKEAVLAGGCFWCVEAVFEELDGVTDVVSGYAGGDESTANYEMVSAGRTKHAEAVRISYDPKKVSYEDLLRVHFATHDPTTLNRQGADVGPQYRSAIFYADEEEKQTAKAFIDQLNQDNTFGKEVVTTLEPLEKFYVAEAYHQDYVCNNPGNPYVRAVALPKVDKIRKLLSQDTAPKN